MDGPPAVVKMTPVGMRQGVKVAGLEPLPGKVNYFLGNDPNKCPTDIPTCGAVVYKGAYKGIDLKFYWNGQQMEYDIIVQPGGDIGRVKFQYAGIDKMEVTPEGDLALTLPDGGSLIQKKPYIYQEIAGTRVPRKRGVFWGRGTRLTWSVASRWPPYDRTHPLVIDPVLSFATYLGGSGRLESVKGVAVDGQGNAYVTGSTESFDFPIKNTAVSNPFTTLGG